MGGWVVSFSRPWDERCGMWGGSLLGAFWVRERGCMIGGCEYGEEGEDGDGEGEVGG